MLLSSPLAYVEEELTCSEIQLLSNSCDMNAQKLQGVTPSSYFDQYELLFLSYCQKAEIKHPAW